MRSALSANGQAGSPTLTLANPSAFQAGDEVLIIQMQGTDAGAHEFVRVVSKSGNTLTLDRTLSRFYLTDNGAKGQVVRVPNWHNLTVPMAVG